MNGRRIELTLARKFETVHKSTVTDNSIIPSVLRANLARPNLFSRLPAPLGAAASSNILPVDSDLVLRVDDCRLCCGTRSLEAARSVASAGSAAILLLAIPDVLLGDRWVQSKDEPRINGGSASLEPSKDFAIMNPSAVGCSFGSVVVVPRVEVAGNEFWCPNPLFGYVSSPWDTNCELILSRSVTFGVG